MRTLSIFSTLQGTINSCTVKGHTINECVDNYIKSQKWGKIEVKHTHWNVVELRFHYGNTEYMVFSDLNVDTEKYNNFSVLDTQSNSCWETTLYGKSVQECVEEDMNLDYCSDIVKVKHIFPNVIEFTFEDGFLGYQIYTPMNGKWDEI